MWIPHKDWVQIVLGQLRLKYKQFSELVPNKQRIDSLPKIIISEKTIGTTEEMCYKTNAMHGNNAKRRSEWLNHTFDCIKNEKLDTSRRKKTN